MLVAAVAALVAALCLTVLLGLFRGRGTRMMVLRAGAAVAVAAAVVAVSLVTAAFVATPAARARELPVAASPHAAPRWVPEPIRSGPGYAGIPRWRLLPVPMGTAEALPITRRTGEVGSVIIPASSSHFTARPAIVYLPPAALTGHPRALPVVVALSGQSHSASPLDVVTGGRIAAIMDSIARRHGGVAPIVVIPDQLGAGPHNPMCVDSPLGHVATYLDVDVRTWVLGHLPAADDRKDWTIAGFSEGGTCAIQLGAARPDLFGSLVDVSGEVAPLNKTVAHTIAAGFGGSPSRYAASTPFRILAKHRYRATSAWFSVGATDKEYGPVAPAMAAHASRAGMSAHFRRLAGLRHNWNTGSAGLRWGLEGLETWWPALRG